MHRANSQSCVPGNGSRWNSSTLWWMTNNCSCHSLSSGTSSITRWTRWVPRQIGPRTDATAGTASLGRAVIFAFPWKERGDQSTFCMVLSFIPAYKSEWGKESHQLQCPWGWGTSSFSCFTESCLSGKRRAMLPSKRERGKDWSSLYFDFRGPLKSCAPQSHPHPWACRSTHNPNPLAHSFKWSIIFPKLLLLCTSLSLQDGVPSEDIICAPHLYVEWINERADAW